MRGRPAARATRADMINSFRLASTTGSIVEPEEGLDPGKKGKRKASKEKDLDGRELSLLSQKVV